MIHFLDTNHLVRFVVNDIMPQAQKVRKLLKSNNNFFIPTIVFAETFYITMNHYSKKKQEIADSLMIIMSQNNIEYPNYCLKGINMFIKENISIYDCLIIAEAIENNAKLHTFDKKMMKIFKKYS